MEIDLQHWERISRYLSGNIDKADKAAFEQWLGESNENQAIFDEASKIWNSSRIKYHAPDETELLLLKLKARITREESGGKLIELFKEKKVLTATAASIMLLTTIIYLLSWLSGPDIIIAAGNSVATIYLADSSKVWLNSGSELSYSEKFGQRSRTVTLSGEGYFVIKKDKDVPFVVATEDASVRVLGTTFNLQEKADDAEVILSVAEGTVEMSASEGLDKVIVEANEKATLKKDHRLVKSKIDDLQFGSWRQHNNPAYENEIEKPLNYLSTDYSWRKNKINQSVIEGTLKNSATLASYKNIVLRVSYTKPDGSPTITHVNINQVITAGKTIKYQRRLLDIFTETRSLQVAIESAEIVH